MQINMINKTILLIINPLTFWLTFKPSSETILYDVIIKKFFFYKLIHFSESPQSIIRNYNIKTII